MSDIVLLLSRLSLLAGQMDCCYLLWLKELCHRLTEWHWHFHSAVGGAKEMGFRLMSALHQQLNEDPLCLSASSAPSRRSTNTPHFLSCVLCADPNRTISLSTAGSFSEDEAARLKKKLKKKKTLTKNSVQPMQIAFLFLFLQSSSLSLQRRRSGRRVDVPQRCHRRRGG